MCCVEAHHHRRRLRPRPVATWGRNASWSLLVCVISNSSSSRSRRWGEIKGEGGGTVEIGRKKEAAAAAVDACLYQLVGIFRTSPCFYSTDYSLTHLHLTWRWLPTNERVSMWTFFLSLLLLSSFCYCCYVVRPLIHQNNNQWSSSSSSFCLSEWSGGGGGGDSCVFSVHWALKYVADNQISIKRRGLPCELERKEICPLAFTCLLKVTHLLLLIFLLLWRYSDDGGGGGGENVRTMHGQCNGRVTTNTHGGKKKKKTLLMASCVTLSITDDESTQVNKFLFSVDPVQLMFLPLVQSHASEYSKRPTSNEGQWDFFSSSSFLLSSSSPSSSRSSFVCCFRMTMAFFFLPLLLLLLLCLTDNGPPPHVSKKKKNTNCRHHQNVSNLLEKK